MNDQVQKLCIFFHEEKTDLILRNFTWNKITLYLDECKQMCMSTFRDIQKQKDGSIKI